jgi:hypothetical protein
VSRLPWFSALAAWGTQGTYTGGAHFVEDRTQWALPEPDEGDDGPLRRRYGMAMTHAQDFAVERRHGWTDVPGSVRPTPDARAERRMERYHVSATAQPRRCGGSWISPSYDPRRSHRHRRPGTGRPGDLGLG